VCATSQLPVEFLSEDPLLVVRSEDSLLRLSSCNGFNTLFYALALYLIFTESLRVCNLILAHMSFMHSSLPSNSGVTMEQRRPRHHGTWRMCVGSYQGERIRLGEIEDDGWASCVSE
jgi:hypothetical protein